MPDSAKIRELVENVVSEAFDAHVRALHEQVVDRVMQSVEPLVAAEPSSSAAVTLNSAIAAIEANIQQTDVLKALLDGAAHLAGRIGLFVLRGSSAIGWQARGFRDNDAIRVLNIDTSAGAANHAIQRRGAHTAPVVQFDSRFSTAFGTPPDGICILVPLTIRDKIAALVYADAGLQNERVVDVPALELLVRAAGLWVELSAYRKAAGHQSVARPVEVPAPAQPAMAVAASAASVAAPMTTPVAEPTTAPPVVAEPTVPEVARVQESAPADTAVTTGAAKAVSPEAGNGEPSVPEEELHRKARRFAKLLVDEIILYNQKKVVEGRQHHDLYDRLHDDIEKSRATYEKRYAQTPVMACDYFTQALITGLADHNAALLGVGFSRASS